MKRIRFLALMLIAALGLAVTGCRMSAPASGTGFTIAAVVTPQPVKTLPQPDSPAPSASFSSTEVPSSGQTTMPVQTISPPQTTAPAQTPDVQQTPANASAQDFDDAAFIGDSVTLKLRNYVMQNSALGKATFLCAGSFSVEHAVSYTLNVTYQGNEEKVQDAVAKCGAKKIFIMLGMNDIAPYGIDNTIEKWDKLIDNIKSQTPDAQFYLQSVTPIVAGKEGKKLTNANVDLYNEALKTYAQEKGYIYVDVATQLKDADGSLKTEYCSDPDGQGIHLTDPACQLWIESLYSAVG